MLLGLTFALIIWLSYTIGIPIVIYTNARFNPADIQSELITKLSITSKYACACQCYTNTSCITSNFIGINQTCTLFNAYISEGEVKVMMNINASIISFPNRTTNRSKFIISIN